MSVRIARDAEEWTSLGALTIARSLEANIRTRGLARLALSGGSTPRPVYERLSGPAYRDSVDWRRVEFYWSDERCVSPDDKESNFRMAWETLLSRLPATGPVHRIRGEEGTLAAALYEQELTRVKTDETGLPRLDVILLGLGTDGHTASLFPPITDIADKRRLVVSTVAPDPPNARISLTPRAINAARRIIFLVSGANKASALARTLNRKTGMGSDRTAASLISPYNGDVVWIVDEAASRLLPCAAAPRLGEGYVD